MASQVVSDVRCQRLMHCAASYGERGSLSRRQSYGYHRIGINHISGIQLQGNNNFKEHYNMGRDQKGSANKHKQAQKLHTLGFCSYLASSFLYIVTKYKAFYNGFLGEVASESRRGIEVQMTEPYFSVPVLPA